MMREGAQAAALAAQQRVEAKVDADHAKARAALLAEFVEARKQAEEKGGGWPQGALLAFFRRNDALIAKRIAGHVNAARLAMLPLATTPQARAVMNQRLAEMKAGMEQMARDAQGRWTTDAVEAELARQDAAEDEVAGWIREALEAE